ncbi:transglutaminase family protein [Desulforegula conservatrix]|uniref:transglutaminase family protein n=1 Tax=Desulforegula conservatrix TaxID=153026 RepID=UPI000420F40D|nr:DUF3488 and transglutaminase-like domain-containing protein [Desulforegula conservatrix]
MNNDALDLKPLTISIIIATIPHFQRLPWWIMVWCIFFWGYSFTGHSIRVSYQAKKWILVLLTLAGIAGILSEYRTVLGQDAGVGLICVMTSLKLLEIKNRRDLIITVFIIYFIIISNLLFSSSVMMTFYMFISVFITTSVLVFYTQKSLEPGRCIRISGALLIRALPLMIIMFVFFPRIQGTLWKGFRINSGKAGFSDTLVPGALSDLALTGELAFRVDFKDKKPPVNKLYWKGLVFGNFDGRAWKKSMAYAFPEYSSKSEAQYEYVITLEPSNSRYMFVSGCPVKAPQGSEIQTDGTLKSKSIITERLKYTVLSEESCNELALISPGEEFWALPKSGNYLSLKLGSRWKSEFSSQTRIIGAALDFLRNGGFSYSLRPPKLLTADSVDEFLFSTKKGYCEHYASAFTFLMRASGIPARVVGGYLGGNLNPVGGHITVTQDKAHAWVEVFLENKGWTIIDPTSVVAPDIFTRGLSSAVPVDEMPVLMTLPENRFIGTLWKKTANILDYINHGWNSFVIGYTYNKQKSFFESIGINSTRVSGALYIIFIMLFSGIAIFLVSWKIRFRDPLKKKDPIAWAWIEFCHKMGRIGLNKYNNEGPFEFLERIRIERPDLKNTAEPIINKYIFLKYANVTSNKENISEFTTMVRKFVAGRKK